MSVDLRKYKVKSVELSHINKTIEILGEEGIEEDSIESKVLELVRNPLTARRLIDWIPEVYGLVAVAHLGKVKLTPYFTAFNVRGQIRCFHVMEEPLFREVREIATWRYHQGSSDIYMRVAFRSSILNGANDGLNSGRSLDGVEFTAIHFLGIPAEVYYNGFQSLWDRFVAWK